MTASLTEMRKPKTTLKITLFHPLAFPGPHRAEIITINIVAVRRFSSAQRKKQAKINRSNNTRWAFGKTHLVLAQTATIKLDSLQFPSQPVRITSLMSYGVRAWIRVTAAPATVAVFAD